MSEGVLTILKFCLLALLYLFVARVVWVVGSEMRAEPATPGTPTGGRRARAGRERTRPEPPARRAKGWRLEVVDPVAARGGIFEIAGEVTIGRAGGCGIALPDDTFVSNVHARVFERDGEVWVEDLGSTNGTLVNGKPVTAAVRLRKGDRVQAGSTVLEARR